MATTPGNSVNETTTGITGFTGTAFTGTAVTNHAVLVGGSTSSTVSNLSVGTTGQLLVGASAADPAFGSSASADFTFTSATAAATRTLTVSNTDNTNSASTALIQTTTGGASAGDPFQTFTITGATSWSLGADNSASDAFVIAASTALGTTNVMSVATTGEITYPLQSAFYAYNSVQDSDVTGDATNYTIICDTESYDQNSDYNNSTGVFTAPITGKYAFVGTVTLFQLSASYTLGGLFFTTTVGVFNCIDCFIGVIRDSGNNIILNINAQVPMTAGDTCTFGVLIAGSTKTVDVAAGNGSTTFAGFKFA